MHARRRIPTGDLSRHTAMSCKTLIRLCRISSIAWTARPATGRSTLTRQDSQIARCLITSPTRKATALVRNRLFPWRCRCPHLSSTSSSSHRMFRLPRRFRPATLSRRVRIKFQGCHDKSALSARSIVGVYISVLRLGNKKHPDDKGHHRKDDWIVKPRKDVSGRRYYGEGRGR